MPKAFAIVLLALFCAIPALAQEPEDPLEGMNRLIFSFNEKADRWVVRPLAQGYRAVMPNPAERGVSRFFDNLGEVGNAANHLLQGKGESAANSSGRFLINSTLGLAGFLDIAAEMGLAAEQDEDIGQTLAVWGMGSGPYLMLPLLGPSTLRDAPSRWLDRYLDPETYLEDVGARNATRVIELIDLRASLLDTDRVEAADRYAFMRDVWLQRRDYLIRNGAVEDDFGDGDFLDD